MQQTIVKTAAGGTHVRFYDEDEYSPEALLKLQEIQQQREIKQMETYVMLFLKSSYR